MKSRLLRTKYIFFIITLGLIFGIQKGISEGVQEKKQNTVKEFHVIGIMKDLTEFIFVDKDAISNPTLLVKKGEKVRILFSVPEEDIAHALYIDEFDAFSPTVNPGESIFIEFIANKSGEYIYYCPLPSHKTLGMEGKLVVE